LKKRLNKSISLRLFTATFLNKQPEIHTIRLHGPWIAKVLFVDPCSDPQNLPDLDQDHRCKIPSDWSDWLGPSFRGRVAYRRSFNRPTQLDPDQKVWLVVEEVDFRAEIFLNDQRLGQTTLGEDPFRAEIHNQLAVANLIRIEIEKPNRASCDSRAELAGGLIGSVRLEIEEPV